MSETIWQRDDNWVGAENEDSFVMVNIDTGSYVALNRTAYAVWQVLEAPATVSEIASKLIERFEVSPEECEAVTAMYPNDAAFRSRVVMTRHGFGRGEYKYFCYPLPDLVERLRTDLYPRL